MLRFLLLLLSIFFLLRFPPHLATEDSLRHYFAALVMSDTPRLPANTRNDDSTTITKKTNSQRRQIGLPFCLAFDLDDGNDDDEMTGHGTLHRIFLPILVGFLSRRSLFIIRGMHSISFFSCLAGILFCFCSILFIFIWSGFFGIHGLPLPLAFLFKRRHTAKTSDTRLLGR
jgi:hypothetical protein